MCKVNLCTGYSNAFMWGLNINIRSEWIDCVNADLTFLNILIDSQSIFCLFISTLETRMTKCGYMRISTCLPLGERRTCWFWRTSKIWARRMTTGEKSTAPCVIMYCKQTFICLQEIFTKGLQEHHHRECLCRKN